jgi:hypothetical protein
MVPGGVSRRGTSRTGQSLPMQASTVMCDDTAATGCVSEGLPASSPHRLGLQDAAHLGQVTYQLVLHHRCQLPTPHERLLTQPAPRAQNVACGRCDGG